MVGGAPYAPELTRRVHAVGDPRLVLPGPIYGDGYRQLLFNCRLYIHATEVGGTHPALVEAMGAGRPVLFLDTPENREVAGAAGTPFRFAGPRALETVLLETLEDDRELAAMAERSRLLVGERYRWNDVAAAYADVLEGLC
jgi:glycosyltransferase involved in cell wall biosynthesis